MDEELVKDLQRLYARAVEGCYTVKEVRDELERLGIQTELSLGIMDDLRRLINKGLRK